MTTLPYTTPEAAAIKVRWLAERELAKPRPNSSMYPGLIVAHATLVAHLDTATDGR